MTRAAAISVATMIASSALLAQQLPKPPVFEARTEIVLVDCVVTDKAGRPVRALTANDFIVAEDGKERPIVSFTAFDGGERSARPSGAARADASGATTPQLRIPSATALLVDDGNLSPQQALRLRPVLKTLVAKLGDRRGTLSVVAPWSKISVAQRTPAGTAAMTEPLDRIVGQHVEDRSNFPLSDTEALSAERGDSMTIGRLTSRFLALNPNLTDRLAAMYAHNRAVEVAYDARKRRDVFYGVALLSLDWLAGQPGRHSLLVASAGFAREPNDFRFDQIVTRSMRVNAPISFVDVRGLQDVGLQGVQYGAALSQSAREAPFDWYEVAEGSSALAEETGGIVINNTNDLDAAFGRLIDTIETYYVLGYEPPPDARRGYRTIKVETKSGDFRVLARKGYLAGPSPGR